MTVTHVTRLTNKGAATRARIVEAAAELMFVRGVAATTLDHVRASAGVSSSQIYHYFADKDALVRAVIDYQNDAVVGPQEEVFASLDSLEALRAWRDRIVSLQARLNCAGGCPVAALGSELAELDTDVRDGVSAGFHRWAAAIRVGYARMQALGRLPPDLDTDQLATATLASLQGGLLLAQMHRSTAPLEAALDTTLAYVATLAPATSA